jgi:hypothetical protein
MDFIIGLPNSNGMTVILVVIDRLTKYAHFLALSYPIGAATVAQMLMDIVVKLHGWPSVIITDRDPVFMNRF